jgi:hypothetical protein
MRRSFQLLSFLVALSVSTSLVQAAGAPTQLLIAAGNNQSAAAGSAVAGPVCAQVLDSGNNPVSGVTVTWGSVTGGGNITGATQLTNSSGIATLGSWTLGPTPGANSITATSGALTPITFNATATAGASNLAIAAGNNQFAGVGALVPGVVCVIATDVNGLPVPGVTVTWGNVTGGGSITGATQVTGSNGIATLGSWMLGPTPGINTITATAGALPPLVFTATSQIAQNLLIAIGNNQTTFAGTAVPGIVCVEVTDANNQPVSGVSVTWGNITGGGSLIGATQLTDATGIATLGGWILGPTPGTNTITASSTGLTSVTFTATGVAQSQSNVVLQWDNALLTAIAAIKMPPPQASRAMAMVHTAIFDAWAAYDTKAVGTRLGDKLRRPANEQTTANKAAAISFAAYRILLDLFASQKTSFDTLMTSLSLDPTDTSTDPTTPSGIGNTVAAEILTFRHSDGSNQLGDLNPGPYSDYTSYTSVNDPDHLNNPSRWQPLRNPDGTVPLYITPQWGLVTPFAIGPQSTRKLTPKNPPTYPGSAYTKETTEILTFSAELSDLTKTIATYWVDNKGTVTPPGHWLQFGQFVSARDRHSLDDDVKMFFALGNAVLDAGIACWDCKRKFDSVRPITSIRFLFKGKTVTAWNGPGNDHASILGETWQPYIPTPPFPEYVSGHSTFSAAGATILQLFTKKSDFGMSVLIPANSSFVEPNVPATPVKLSWKNFKDAADQAGISRRYGGIHFKDGDMNGRALGKKVATIVFKKAQEYIDGKVKQ